nr:hypothetical protein [Paracandidimonas lactea]
MNTFDMLKQQFGPLLTLQDLSSLLQRSPDGLRISLSSSREAWATQINSTKIRIGRRVYFRTAGIAELIDKEFATKQS